MEIPNGWEWIKLGDVCEKVVGGGTPSTKKPEYWQGDIPWITSADINGLKDIRIRKHISQHAILDSATNLLPKGGIVVVTRVGLGKIALTDRDLCFSQDSQGLIVNQNKITTGYALWCLSDTVQIFKYNNQGTTISGVTKKQLIDLQIPLPPLPEQHRIVAKIEALFSSLDKGIENLKTAQQQLKVYRQAVLKWAFDGKLTNDNVKDGGLPDGWKWVKLGDVIAKIEAGKSFKCDERPPRDNEFGIVKVSAVTWGTYNEMESKTCYSNNTFNSRHIINQGDFLFSRANTLELVGACVIAHKPLKNLMLSDKILRIIYTENVVKKYVLHYLRSRKGRNEIEQKSSGNQMSMRNIGQEKIRQIQLPFAPLPEQQAIVSEIESRLSVCDKLEESITFSLKQAEALRQSILKKAFEGKLVPHDPGDEPASELLDRIKAEKEKNKPVKKVKLKKVKI